MAGSGFQEIEKLFPWVDVAIPHKMHQRRAMILEQRERDRTMAGGRTAAEQVVREIKGYKLACGPAYENFGTGDMLQLTDGMVNSHTSWNVTAGGDPG